MAANFDLAPPTTMVDGLLAVPIDISSIAASLVFDGGAQAASGDATITYAVGPTAGNPIFDLRQTVTQAWLDGAPFPVSQLSHHAFGAASFTDLRVIEAVQAAGSVHTLRLQYGLAVPNSQLGGSYLPAIEWSAGPRLKFVFGLSDLNRARYAEAWLPANLLFDQYEMNLEMEIVNTVVAHSLITNGAVTNLGPNHWQIQFPARFSAPSPLLEMRASDTLMTQSDTVALPVSGKTVTIEAWRLASSTVNLTTEINNIKTHLSDNETNYGPYFHENRFVAFFNGSGGMEYEGGTTTSTGALLHETFHSWFARGIKPSSQSDGWWDEGFTSFHDAGADDAVPFDFSDPPILLCSRDPWQRHTPSNSYADGSRFWRGMASLLGIGTLNGLMRDLYEKYGGQPVSTQMVEEFLVSKSGNQQVVDAFHRFVYGFSDASPTPSLWLKDDVAHTGADDWDGPFWDSPDLWVRNADDGGTVHQAPEYGQDNWLYARVRNGAGSGSARHFVVTFHARGFAGTEFVYPNDFLPSTTAAVGFELDGGDSQIVKARWPRALVPPAGSHTCLLAAVLARGDHPASGMHVWEHNNLAQKNLTIVDLQPNWFMILPIVVGNLRRELDDRFSLELWNERWSELELSIVHRSRKFFSTAGVDVRRFEPAFPKRDLWPRLTPLDCGGFIPHRPSTDRGDIITSETPHLVLERYGDAWEAVVPEKVGLAVAIPPLTQQVVGLKIAAPREAKPGDSFKLHFVQRHEGSRRIVGGVAVVVNVVAPERDRHAMAV